MQSKGENYQNIFFLGIYIFSSSFYLSTIFITENRPVTYCFSGRHSFLCDYILCQCKEVCPFFAFYYNILLNLALCNSPALLKMSISCYIIFLSKHEELNKFCIPTFLSKHLTVFLETHFYYRTKKATGTSPIAHINNITLLTFWHDIPSTIIKQKPYYLE